MKGLVVDPSPTSTRIIARALRLSGCTEVLTVRDLGEARELVKRGAAPDLEVVVIERDLPGGDDIEFLRELRPGGQPGEDAPGATMILVTIPSFWEDVLAVREVGVDGYIRKPFSAATLVDRIERVRAAGRQRAA